MVTGDKTTPLYLKFTCFLRAVADEQGRIGRGEFIAREFDVRVPDDDLLKLDAEAFTVRYIAPMVSQMLYTVRRHAPET